MRTLGQNRSCDPTRRGLYVHIPFCLSRCSYCAFATGLYDSTLADEYVDCLGMELARQKSVFAESIKPATLFIGGGTPTALSSAQLEKLLSLLPFPDAGGEATCEINPDSLDGDTLALLAQAGINRCSFGVQTFSKEGLTLLGRRHDAETARKKITAAVEFGRFSVSLDLISGWPGQGRGDLLHDLRQACDLGVNHISCYNLTREKNSRLSRLMDEQGLAEKTDSEMRELWDVTGAVLEKAGYIHYETSNFAKPGFACRHNVDIWKGGEYLGIGAAAHSHVSGRRFANHPDAAGYVDMMKNRGGAEIFSERLEPSAKAKECAVFWLRLTEGIECREFQRRTGFDLFDLYKEELPSLINRGLLSFQTVPKNGSFVAVRRECRPVLDAILVELV